MKYKALLIGLGRIGMSYDYTENSTSDSVVLSHAQALSSHDDFELVGGVDSCPQQREKFFQKFKTPVYKTVYEALAIVCPEIVIIATSTASHLEVCKAVLAQLKPRLIVLEKPIAYSVDDSYAIIELGKSAGVTIAVNYFRAYEPAHKRLSEKLSNGFLGFPLTAVVRYTNGMINNGSHWVQYLSAILGDLETVDMSAHTNMLADDFSGEVKISFSNGSVYFVPFQSTEYYLFEIDIYGPLGKISIDSSGDNIKEYLAIPDPAFPSLKILSNEPNITIPAMHQYQRFMYDEIIQFLEGKGLLSCTTESLFTALEVYSQLEYQKELK